MVDTSEAIRTPFGGQQFPSRKSEAELDGIWRESLPCADCSIREVCRYYSHIKRPDYNKDVFTVTVECKIKDSYRRNDNG